MSMIESIAHLLDIHAGCDERLTNQLVPGMSSRIAAIYSELLTDDVPDEVVVCAMLGATVALCESMDLTDALPGMLRTVARGIEQRSLAGC